MGQKHAFLEFIEKIGCEFLLILYYLVCSSTNPIFGKILVSEYGPKCSQTIILKEFFINHVSGTNL